MCRTSEGELRLRPLSRDERWRAFRRPGVELVDLRPFVKALQEALGDVAYEVAFPGLTGLALRRRLTLAAKQLGLVADFLELDRQWDAEVPERTRS